MLVEPPQPGHAQTHPKLVLHPHARHPALAAPALEGSPGALLGQHFDQQVQGMPIGFLGPRTVPRYFPAADPRGFPTALPEFQRVFLSAAACAAYLEKLRWPGGFACPKCGTVGEPYRFPKCSSVVLRCRGCQAKVSLPAGTVRQASHLPLSRWFRGVSLVTTRTPGPSALQFQRQLGINRDETAFQALHKLRVGMVRPDRDPMGGPYPAEIDEPLGGGRTRGKGRGVHHQATVVGAVPVRFKREAKGCS